MRSKTLVLTALLFSAGLCLADCPSADNNGDCLVNYEDFALMAAQWLTADPDIPDDMVYIPYGGFEMGDHFGDAFSDELPLHPVLIDSFCMGKYEVTNAQYCAYLNSAFGAGIYISGGIVYGTGNNKYYCDTSASSSYSQIAYSGGVFSVRTKNGRNMSNDAMVQVTWYGAAAYCNWRSGQEGRGLCYNLSSWSCDFGKHGYRLPTEAEWEYAARGGLVGKRFPWGDTISHNQANYYSSSGDSYDVSPTRGYHPGWDDVMPYTSPGGSFAANNYGLYDMTGNVYEWCNDWWITDYYDTSPYDNPTGPANGTSRVVRSGAWFSDAGGCRVAYRYGSAPATRYSYIGFRLVLNLN